MAVELTIAHGVGLNTVRGLEEDTAGRRRRRVVPQIPVLAENRGITSLDQMRRDQRATVEVAAFDFTGEVDDGLKHNAGLEDLTRLRGPVPPAAKTLAQIASQELGWRSRPTKETVS